MVLLKEIWTKVFTAVPRLFLHLKCSNELASRSED